MQWIYIAYILSALILIQNNCHGSNANCIVQLSSGLIIGNCTGTNYDSYTHIPYAEPPIGVLRFESPQPIRSWSGIRNADEAVVMCIQYYQGLGRILGTEDCLYVNVYVPKRQVNDNLMVIVWIYPGSFQLGGPTNSPELVISVGGAILVTFGYRVGPTGFLSTNDNRIPGNMGLKDQRLCIEWIWENIGAFGGDANQIMLLGDSAGGASVEYHMIVGNSRPRAFGALSGSVLNPWAFSTNPEVSANRLGEILNCPLAENGTNVFKDCLKTRAIEDIWQAAISMHEFYGFRSALFRPTIEPEDVLDAFLTEHPVELIKKGAYKDKPYLVGLIENEGVYMAANLLQRNKANTTEVIEELNNNWYELCPFMFFYEEKFTAEQQFQICADLLERYMCGRPFNLDSYRLLERMFGDEYFHHGVDESVKLHRAAGQTVYRYIANLPSRYNVANLLAIGRLDLCFGSAHSSDAFAILPVARQFPFQTETQIEIETKRNLIDLIKSMVTQSEPTYKHIKLPANTDNNVPDQCLFFSYGTQRIDTCEFGTIDCNNQATLRCRQ